MSISTAMLCTERLEHARAAMQAVLRDRYEVQVADYVAILREIMVRRKLQVLQALMLVLSDLQNAENAGASQAMFCSAAVEIIEHE